jgi:hypothetical protein
VNARVVLAADVALLPSRLFVDSRYKVEFEQALKAAGSTGAVLSGWGDSLRRGSRVRILSYATFPQLGDSSEDLFALVYVLSE